MTPIIVTSDRPYSCSFCFDSLWILPGGEIGPDDHDLPRIPMRCKCVGGPEKLSELLKQGKPPDFDEARRVMAYFKGIDASQWRSSGMAIIRERHKARKQAVKDLEENDEPTQPSKCSCHASDKPSGDSHDPLCQEYAPF